jgi:hypothetical protein
MSCTAFNRVKSVSLLCGFDPDPAYYLNADPDPTFNLDEDPDPSSHQSDASVRPMVSRPSRAPFFSLDASFISVHCYPRLHLEPLKLLNFDFIADPDPAFPLIRIQNNADPCGSEAATLHASATTTVSYYCSFQWPNPYSLALTHTQHF